MQKTGQGWYTKANTQAKTMNGSVVSQTYNTLCQTA